MTTEDSGLSARSPILDPLIGVAATWPEVLEIGYRQVEGATADDLARLLVAIRDARAALASFADDVSRDLLVLMGDKKMVVEGVGEVEAVKSTKRTKWENGTLARKVIALAYDERQFDEQTGEYEEAGAAVARVLLECARPSWRLGPLRARGIDPDEYCTVDEGVFTVRLPGREI